MRLARLGYDEELPGAFMRWSGSENLEERVEGIERIDPVVLRKLRGQSG
jgi:putative peptidoglycan binding protein